MALVVVASLLVAVFPARADGIEWTSRTPAADNNWSSVAYGKDRNGDGLWVAVATSGTHRVMTSPDGIDWRSRNAAANNLWQSVAYGKDGNGDALWVAVANNGTHQVMTSPDGINWEPKSAAAANGWLSVAYGNGRWVAVGEAPLGSNRVMTSADGSNWTIPNSNPALVDNSWVSVAYGNGLWVAVAGGGTHRVMTSPDAIDWTPRSAAANNDWKSVSYGKDGNGVGLWVAVAAGGTGDRVMTSPDGINWTIPNSIPALVDKSWFSVSYGKDGNGAGLWVAVAYLLDSTVMTSPDGINWTTRNAAANSLWSSVAYGDGLWVAVGAGGFTPRPHVMTSGAMNAAVEPAAVERAALSPSLSCAPLLPEVGGRITCTVSGGDEGIDILWRAAYNPVIAEDGVTLDASGSGVFSFVVPAAAVGEVISVELVEWLAPVSLGAAGGPVPMSVPAGGGPVAVWPVLLLALAGGLALRRRSRSGWPPLRVS